MNGRRFVVVGAGIWIAALGITAGAQHDKTAASPRPAPPAAVAAAPANDDCLVCHDDDSATRGDGRPVVVKTDVFRKSIHADLSCVDCHADLATTTDYPHPEKLKKVDCAACHDEPVAQYQQSAHAKARASGTDVAATCVDCHGTHDMRSSSDPESRTHHLHLEATCAKCHGNAAVIAKGGIPSDVTKAFADSIHGRALRNGGTTKAPTCSDCHGAHDIRKPKDPASSVAMTHVASTCGKCHEKVATQFTSGMHGQQLAHGGKAPACQTCHSAHSIQHTVAPTWQLSVIQQCGTCHAERIATFKDTFHGKVTDLGFRSVASCADCHGPHEILPASDPKSPIAPANLVATCGKCHKDANENFVKYDPHPNPRNYARSPLMWWIRQFYTVLIAGCFGFFGLHSLFWFRRSWRNGDNS